MVLVCLLILLCDCQRIEFDYERKLLRVNTQTNPKIY